MAVNDQDYRFEVVLYLMLSWNDPRARPAVVNSTQRAATDGGECALPCTSLYRFEKGAPCCDGVWLPHLEFTNARGFSQDRVVRYGIRVPEPNATNPSAVRRPGGSWLVFCFVVVILVLGFVVCAQPQRRAVASAPAADGSRSLTQFHPQLVQVVWWVHVHGEFYTPLSFRAFPFDKQQ